MSNVEEVDNTIVQINSTQAQVEIEAGAKALRMLLKTAGHNWVNGWSIAVRGWRGLRILAFDRAGTNDTSSQAYRDAMNSLLQLVKHVDYQNIPKETRSAMTRLIDHIDEIDQWYATLSVWEKERWTNPQTIVKHAPPHLLSEHGHNMPKSKRPKKKKGNPEAEALRATLIRIILKYVQPVDPEEAKKLLEGLYESPDDPDDSLEGVFENVGKEEA